MVICVRLFARAKDLVGVDRVVIELPPEGTVENLRREMAVRHPVLKTLLGHCAVAVNDEFAAEALPLSAGDEVALLPPVSGG